MTLSAQQQHAVEILQRTTVELQQPVFDAVTVICNLRSVLIWLEETAPQARAAARVAQPSGAALAAADPGGLTHAGRLACERQEF